MYYTVRFSVGPPKKVPTPEIWYLAFRSLSSRAMWAILRGRALQTPGTHQRP